MEKDWQQRLTEARSFVREYEEQMRRLSVSAQPRGLDSETLRTIARIREQENFLQRMSSIDALALSGGTASVRRLGGPFDLAAKTMESDPALADALARIGKLTGPGSVYDLAKQSLTDFTKRFHVPEFNEMSRLLPKMQDSIWLQYGLPKSDFERFSADFASHGWMFRISLAH